MSFQMQHHDSEKIPAFEINNAHSKVERTVWSNPGLLFDRGFKEWKKNNEKRGQDIQHHIQAVCLVAVPEMYKQALKRWYGITGDVNGFATAVGTLENRLYIGLGMPHVLETQITRQQTWGMPCIPGSALKGLARAQARQNIGEESAINEDIIRVLFGHGGDTPEECDTGYLVFHDAWWIPGLFGIDTPYHPETVTVHATRYYQNQGEDCPHPDLESPNPNNQIAVQGSFYFVVEGKRNWAELGLELLKSALIEHGIGGKVASGYGYFNFPDRRDCRKIIEKSHALFKAEKEGRKKKLQKMRDVLTAARKAEKVADLDRFRKAMYMLEQALRKREKTGRTPANEKINRLVNLIIKDREPWPQDRRLEAESLIVRAYGLTMKGRKRKKKLEQIRHWSREATGITCIANK